MKVDPFVSMFAAAMLKPKGWTHDATIAQLAQRIQDVCEDFEADLANDEARHE